MRKCHENVVFVSLFQRLNRAIIQSKGKRKQDEKHTINVHLDACVEPIVMLLLVCKEVRVWNTTNPPWG